MAPRREAEISLYTALVPIPALFPHLAKKPSTATAAELLQTGCTTALYERIWNEKHQPKLQSYRRKVLRKEKRPREGSQLEGGAQRPQKRKRTPVNPDSWKPPLPECANIPEIDLPNNFPSGSLLSSIHTHASNLLAESHLLLPILTPEAPYLPAPILAHIDDLRLALDAIDRRKGNRNTREGREWTKTARSDLSHGADHLKGWKGEGWKAGDGKLSVTTKAKGWRDVEKKWEGSALIAIGILMDLLASHAMRDSLVDPDFEMTESEKEARAALAAKEARAKERGLAKVEEARIRAEQRALRPKAPKKRKKKVVIVARATPEEESDEEMNEPFLDLDNLPPLPELIRPRSSARRSSESLEAGDVNRRRSFASFLNSQANSQVDPPVVSPPRMSDSDDSMVQEDDAMAGGDRSDSSEGEAD